MELQLKLLVFIKLERLRKESQQFFSDFITFYLLICVSFYQGVYIVLDLVT